MKNLILPLIIFLTACQTVKEEPTAKPLTPKDLCQHNPQVKIDKYQDKTSAGWALKKDDWAYVASVPGCKSKWNVVTWKESPNIYVEIKDQCNLSANDLKPLYDKALCNVTFDYPADQIKNVSGFGLYGKILWKSRMIEASKNSSRWKSFLESRKKTRFLPSNSIFVEVFNQAKVAREMKDLFKEYNLVVDLKSVEKVFEEKQNMTGAGVYHFESNIIAPATQ